MNNLRFDTINSVELYVLLFLIFIIIFILFFFPKFNSKKLMNKNEHGSSKFASTKEIRESFDKENINDIKNVGFPVYYEKENNHFKSVYFDTKSPHYLLVGSTGSGKSATVSIPMAIHFAIAEEKHSVVLTDPKGELFMKTGQLFKDNGYDVITIDFRNPNQSTKINIMQPIIDEWKKHCYYYNSLMIFLTHFIKTNKISLSKIVTDEKYLNQIKLKYKLEDYIVDIIVSDFEKIEKNKNDRKFYEKVKINDIENLKEYLNTKSNEELLEDIKKYQNESAKHQAETNRLTISLASLIFVEKEQKDPYWLNASKQLFIGLTGIFIEDYKEGLIDENKINLSSIKKFMTSSLTKENHMYLQKILNKRSYGCLSKDYLTSILSSAENTYKSITAIFGEKMSIFDDLNVENITSVSEFEFSSLGKKPTVLYIIVPDEDRAYFQLVTIIVGMLIKDLTKFANLPENGGTLPIKVEWILDEFANCPKMDSIETIVSVARSRGMRFYFFIQSFSQLDQIYGKEISNIIQDNCALAYLKTNTVETAEIIAKKLGKATIETSSMSMSTDTFKVGANKTLSLIGKELLTANEIIGLKYKTIIFPTFGNPIFRDTYLYSDIYPKYKKYPIYQREIKVLKRLTQNYYTVEKMRNIYNDKDVQNNEDVMKKMETSYKRMLNTQMKEIKNSKNTITNNNLLSYVQELKNKLQDKIINEYKNDDGTYFIELSTLLNKFELHKLKKNKDENIVLEVGENLDVKKTILMIWNNSDI